MRQLHVHLLARLDILLAQGRYPTGGLLLLIKVSELTTTVVHCALAALLLTAMSGNTVQANSTAPVGVHMGPHASWAPAWFSVDILTKSRRLVPGRKRNGNESRQWNVCQNDPDRCARNNPMRLDREGWVTSFDEDISPHTLVFDSIDGDYPSGRYLILWEGNGVIELSGDVDRRAASDCNAYRVDSGRGCFTVTTPTDQGIRYRIETTDPSDPIRNIKILAPGGVPGVVDSSGTLISVDHTRLCMPDDARSKRPTPLEPGKACIDFEHSHWNRFRDPVEWINTRRAMFHPVFLEKLRNFSVLRFMQWQQINDSEITAWNQKTSLKRQTWSGAKGGVPPEILFALANAVEATPWVNLPHMTTPEYSRRFARLAKKMLPVNRTVIVEWSNEVWNSGFSQTRWVIDKATKTGIPGSQAMQRANRYLAEQTILHADAWREVIGTRARVVIASQSSNYATAKERLEWKQASRAVDALAIAPYFGFEVGSPDTANAVIKGGLKNLFNDLTTATEINGRRKDGLLGQSIRDMQANGRIASRFGVSMVAYEAGQHLVGHGPAITNDSLTALFTEANADPRMGALYKDYMNAWRNSGGGLLIHHTHTGSWGKFGSWGLVQRQSDPPESSPKYAAVLDFIRTNPCWWDNCSVEPLPRSIASQRRVSLRVTPPPSESRRRTVSRQ